MKQLLFVTGCFPKGKEEYYLENSINPYSLASNVLSWRIIDGIDAINDVNLRVYSCPFVPFYPFDYKSPILKSYFWDHKGLDINNDLVIGCLNIKYLGIYHKSLRLKNKIINWLDSSKDNRNILFYSNDISFMRLVRSLKAKYNDLSITVLITDLNEFDNDPVPPQGIKQHIKKWMFDYRINTIYSNMKYVDSFILLAERMKDFINIGNRPYLICEGICNMNMPYIEYKGNNKINRVLYTGNIHKRYGILKVIEAIKNLPTLFDLYICGDGDAKELVTEYANNYQNIHYLGMLPNDDVIILQQSADLLVNSMPNFGRHTELSFPSKLMEYMVQGRPVMCHKVPGIPYEYDEYLIYFNDESVDGITKSLIDFANMSFERKKQIGEANRRFIIENKNQFYQARRICNFIFNE